MTKRLKFEYCECGCHGSWVDFGVGTFWSFTHLDGRDEPFELYSGHQGVFIRKFKTCDAKDNFAYEQALKIRKMSLKQFDKAIIKR